MQNQFVKIMIATLLFVSASSHAEVFVQLHHSLLGEIFADDDEFEINSNSYESDNIDFDSADGARILIDIYYLSYRRINTVAYEATPDIKVNTYSIGLGCLSKNILANGIHVYAMTGLGAGSGEFIFQHAEDTDWELMIEANFETGVIINDHFTLGLGAEAQHFGSFSESKGTALHAYVSAGFMF